MGRNLVNFGTWFFGASWLFIIGTISVETHRTKMLESGAEGLAFSGNIVFAHSFFFFIFCIWRAIGAWLNFRRSGQPGVTIRHSYSIGDSVIYPIIRFILRPLRLIDDNASPKTLLKINEDRWMQFWEPILIILGGYVLGQAGYTAYGNFLFFAGICFWYSTFRAFNNTAKIRQAQADATAIGGMIEKDQTRKLDRPHVIGD